MTNLLTTEESLTSNGGWMAEICTRNKFVISTEAMRSGEICGLAKP
jgi:hypothetical protein